MCFNKIILNRFFLFKEKARKKIKKRAVLSPVRILSYSDFDSPSSFHSLMVAKTTRNHVEGHRFQYLSFKREMNYIKVSDLSSRASMKA